MTTVLTPPPPAAPPASPGRRPGSRAINRWAWRLLRREWRQQVLILALLALAVAGTTVGLGVVVNVQSDTAALTGTAATRIDVADPGRHVAEDLASARSTFGTVEAIVHENVPVPGSVIPIDLRAQDPHGIFGYPMLRLVAGHYPTGAGQVAVTSAVATALDLAVGGSWTVDGRPLRVVGLVENPRNLDDRAFALVPPGQIRSPSSLSLLLDATGHEVSRFRPSGGSPVGIMSLGQTRAQLQRDQALAVLLLTTIGLTFIGLLAVAGFTVMAQRRLRAVGMIGAIGATDRQVRRVMLANGTAVGAVGASVGVVLGLLGWLAFRPAFESLAGHRIRALSLPWWAVIAGALLAVVTALVASWWPARSVARMPIVAALSGRPAPPRPAHRFALVGVPMAALGFVLLVIAHSQHPPMIIGGIVATTVGMLLLAPLGIRALAAGAGRAPVAVRLALRDLARYQARSGAALAAASLAVGIAATIAVTASAQQATDTALRYGNLSPNQLIVWIDGNPSDDSGPGGGVVVSAAPSQGGRPTGPSPAAIAAARGAASSIARALGAGAGLELDVAVDPRSDAPPDAGPDAMRATVVRPFTTSDGHGFHLLMTPYVATPAVLAVYRVPAGVITTGTDILTSRSDLSGTQIGTDRSFVPAALKVTALLPTYTSAPNTLITENGVARLGLTARPAGWLMQAAHPLTTDQINDARRQAAAAGLAIETRTAPSDHMRKLRDYGTAGGGLVALGVLAMTVGLIRSETAGDLRTLTASGAGGGTRRTLTAATAGALALLGGILGTAGAYLAMIAWNWRNLGYLSHPPYVHLAVLVFGLPIAAVTGAWLASRTPAAIARRPLE
jgi:putative ABC transport system permease protein